MKHNLFKTCVCAALLLILILVWNMTFNNVYTKSPVIVQNGQINPVNSEQYHATIQMTTVNNKLCFYYSEDSSLHWDPNFLAGYVCVFEDGTVHRLKKLDDSDYRIFYNGCVYYQSSQNEQSAIRCYDISQQTDIEIKQTAWDAGRTMGKDAFYISPEGILHIPANADKTTFISVSGSEICGESTQQETYNFGPVTYIVDHSGYGKAKLFAFQDQKRIDDYSGYFNYGVSGVFACETGLVVYEQSDGYHLYYICGETGEIVQLFTAECARSVSAINIYQNNVYLSFLRYESYEVLNVKRYENDVLEGTWCFNLDTGSSRKISESIYNGMFIFDDTGIFACDEDRNIYKLDFDGNVIMTLLKH